jgi:peptidyl-prolyl cis-trans isomerase C
MPIRVNNNTLSDEEVSAEEARITQHLATRVPPEQLEAMKEVVKKQAAESLINRTLLKEAVENEGIEVSGEELDERMEMVKSKFESPEAYSQQLVSLGITQKELRSEMETSLRMEKLLQKHVGTIEEPTDAEVETFYKENEERFKQPEMVRASHILIKTEPQESEPERSTKRLEAAKVLGEIQNGADFGRLASQHSACPSKERGGDLGYFERGRMVKPFEDAAFSLGSGEVSDLVETQFGYHIVKVTDRQQESTAPFETAKDDISTFLKDQKREQAVKAYTDKLRAEATIKHTD